ncbi:MAG: glycosyltransferase [Chloroflexota bacterium]
MSEKFPPQEGGLAVSAARLAHLLAAHGESVQVFSLSGELAPGERQVQTLQGLQVHLLGARRRTDDTLADWFDMLAEQHAAAPFDVLHAYYVTQAGFLAVYAGGYLGLPSVVSARGNDLERAIFDPGKAAHTLYALQHASAITTNARHLARKAQALAPGRQVSVIPNGVEAQHFQPMARDAALAAELGLGPEPVIAFVGEARAKKGLATLLLAFRQAAQTLTLTPANAAQLWLLGGVRSGEDKELFKVFRKQNPDLHVHVTPYLPQERLPACYSLVDLLVMPSLRDGLPNALLEGMACECAILTTPVGGILDAIRDGENGRLASPGDAPALAAAMVEILADAELRRRLGRAARQTVLRDFTPQQELQGNLEVYRALVRF